MKKLFLAVFIILGVIMALFSWYDEQLFTSKSTTQKPFIMIMMDTSGSMNNVVWYPKDGISGTALDTGYIPTHVYEGTIDFDDTFGFDANFGDELKVNYFPATGGGGFYYGWRVRNTSSTFKDIYNAYKQGQTLELGVNTIRVTQSTYNWVTDPANYWVIGKSSGAYAQVSRKRITSVGNNTYYWFDIGEIKGTFPDNNTAFVVNETLFGIQPLAANEVLKRGYFYSYPGNTDERGYVRYSENHLKWLLGYASNSETYPYGQLQETSYFHKYGTFDTSITSSRPAEIDTNCKCSSVTAQRLVMTRIQAGREAMCKITNVNWGKIVLGVFKFNLTNNGDGTTGDGGEVIENLNNESSQENVRSSIFTKTVAPDSGNTPLAAALADLWVYWKPSQMQGKYWPTGWGNDGLYHSYSPSVSTAGWGPPGLQANECTHFYNIIVTDGQSTNDKFSNSKFNNSIFKSPTKSPVKRTGELTSRWHYKNGWGDYDNNDPNNNSTTYCADAATCWLSGGTDYLDDVAYLMYHSDMCPNQSPVGYPEEDLYGTKSQYYPGDQNIVTHIVGFNMVNDMLRETATNGGGQFYLSNNYEDLSNQLQAAINEIYLREEQMMYNVFASPKQAVTAKSDLFGFKGTFVPQNGNTFWEGHLKCFQLDQNGEFPDDSPANTKWDAYDKMKSTASSLRKIYTFKYSEAALIDSSNAFIPANITPTNLGLASDNTTGRDSVVSFIRGENGFDYKLGDIFHFNPIVVGSPLIWKGAFDATYQAFYTANVGRKEVVYVGTNDGMLHCIQVEKKNADGDPDVTLGGEELWGFIPPSQLARVKNLYMISAFTILKDVLANCTSIPTCTFGFDRYFVDGKGMVTDIKIGTEWKTVLIFGMGIGGRSYCALDVTNPDEPKFLWEFTDPLMGYTEARPIISNVNDGTSTYPAVFIPGGYDYWERPAVATDANSKLGKALFVLKAEPGTNFSAQAVKKFIWDGAVSGEAAKEGDVYKYTSTDFKYSFVAAPAVFDPNGDGIADYVYACDTGDYRPGQPGGRIWKIPVLGVPSGWTPTKIFQSPDRQTFFLSPTLGYDVNWHLWIFVGTGRRSQITSNDGGHICVDPITGLTTTCYTFTNTNGQFYAFWDKATNPTPLDGTSATYFKNITSLFANPSATDADKKLESSQIGIYFDYFRQSPEVIFEPTPIFVDNVLTFNTYTPTVASGSTTCGSSTGFSGRHSIYQFALGKIGTSIAITSTNSFGGKILGSGVLSSGEYIVYIGAETVGTFTTTNYYRPSLEDTFGPILWKEDKQ